MSELAKQLVLETLTHNRLSYGPMAERFELEFSMLHGCRFAVMTNSGTSALQVSLQAMKETHGWSDGDEVIVPSLTFVATANIVLHNRMVPVLVDIDPVYYGLDPALLEAAITPKTRAIIPVHLFGQPADMDPLCAVARRHSIKIIEDSCETMFADYNGKRVGSLGEIGCFSTYVAHLLVTGVGGICTTNDPDYAVRLRSLINHGRDSIYISIDDDDEQAGERLRMIVARRFKFTSVGHSFRITEMEAALGLAQLAEWESIISAHRTNARSLSKKLAHLEPRVQLPKIRSGSDHSFMMFPLVLREEPKEDLCYFLERHGVETRDMFPLTSQPLYQKLLGLSESRYPVAQQINRGGFYVGCHQDLTESDLDYVAGLIDQYLSRKPDPKQRGSCLVLLTHNCREIIERALEEIPHDLFRKIVAIDDRSRDGTVEFLKQRGISFVPLEEGSVFRTAAKQSLTSDCESLVFFAVNGQHNPRDLGRLVLALERGCDMVIASRFLPGGARYVRGNYMTPKRSFGNRLYTLLANLLFYGTLTDTLNTVRAVTRRRLLEPPLIGRGLSGFYQLSIRSMAYRWKVEEIPSREVVVVSMANRMRVFLNGFSLLYVLLREWLAWKIRRFFRKDKTT